MQLVSQTCLFVTMRMSLVILHDNILCTKWSAKDNNREGTAAVASITKTTTNVTVYCYYYVTRSSHLGFDDAVGIDITRFSWSECQPSKTVLWIVDSSSCMYGIHIWNGSTLNSKMLVVSWSLMGHPSPPPPIIWHPKRILQPVMSNLSTQQTSSSKPSSLSLHRETGKQSAIGTGEHVV